MTEEPIILDSLEAILLAAWLNIRYPEAAQEFTVRENPKDGRRDAQAEEPCFAGWRTTA